MVIRSEDASIMMNVVIFVKKSICLHRDYGESITVRVREKISYYVLK